jgi:hypothetical protein
MRLALALALVLAVAACGHPKRDRFADDVAKMQEFTDLMCRCTADDKACADTVMGEMNRWSAIEAQESRDLPKPDEAMIKRMQDIGTRYGECMARAYGASSSDTPPAPPPLPTGEKITSADRIIKLTFDGAGANTVGNVELSYVRSDGTLDPAYGRAEFDFGKRKKPKPADDPNRPLGAPVPVDDSIVDDVMAKCPTHTWSNGVDQQREGPCMTFGAVTRPRCSVLEVWKRAIEAGAPAAGLAVLRLRPTLGGTDGAQEWEFSIDDTPRNLHFSHEVSDTCDPTLEKPTPVPPGAGSTAHPNPY